LNRFPDALIARYLKRGRVQGWLDAFSAQVIAEISSFQNRSSIEGAVAEIGIHHGKLFFVLYLTTKRSETALAIDVFDAQHLNIDHSGQGNKRIFLEHARKWTGMDGLKLLEKSSLEVSPGEIIEAVGHVRLFSIDGSHTEDATLNDLRLADATLTPEGVVVLDDVFQEFWPEVSVALGKFITSSRTLLPFAITPNKVFLARPKMAPTYAEALTNAFPQKIEKTATYYGGEVKLMGVLKLTLRARFGKTKVGRLIKRVLGRGT